MDGRVVPTFGYVPVTRVFFLAEPKIAIQSSKNLLTGISRHVVMLPVVAFLFAATQSRAQGAKTRSVTGKVIDTSGVPVPNVKVDYRQGGRVVTTDSGTFSISSAPVGNISLLVRRIGFEPAEIRIASGADTNVLVRLVPIPVRLSNIRVVAEEASRKLSQRGFYDRMRDVERGINRGYFITPEDLEQRKPNFITQMLESYPTIRVRRDMAGEYFARIVGSNDCPMTVYLDGARVIGKLGGIEDPINSLVKPYEIAGAEIYPRGVGAPPQYQSLNGSCGIVLIWTK